MVDLDGGVVSTWAGEVGGMVIGWVGSLSCQQLVILRRPG